MNKFVQECWDRNEKDLKETFREMFNQESTYEDILMLTIDTIFGNYDAGGPDSTKIKTLTYGEWGGFNLYIIEEMGGASNPHEVWMTHNYYGTCSYCDTLQRIKDMCNDDDWNFQITEDAVKQLYILGLHLMQRMKRLTDWEGEF